MYMFVTVLPIYIYKRKKYYVDLLIASLYFFFFCCNSHLYTGISRHNKRKYGRTDLHLDRTQECFPVFSLAYLKYGNI